LDLLGQGDKSAERYRKIFTELCSQKVEGDGLTLLPETIRVERIRDEEEYEGVRVLLTGRVANARIPLQIDVGFGDVITPGPIELEYPTLLSFPAPKLCAYSKESVVAEKVEAMVKLGIANSRMKDFYDLWVMARQFEFGSPVLSAAIQATFERRRTALPSSKPLALTAEFAEAPSKQTQWKAFLRKSGLNASESLSDVITVVDGFVMPVLEGIVSKSDRLYTWLPGGPWKPSA
jgi:Nucleotidyl transferase AbiEii toxin, Type IV TA system